MRLRTITTAIAGAAAAALALTACGGGASTASSGTSAAQSATSAVGSATGSGSSAAPGSSVAAGDSKVLSDAAAGKLVVGIKFDQPGLGLKNPDGSFSGFDVEVAKYVGQKLGVDPANIEFKEAKSAEREGLIDRGEVDYIVATYSITDARKEKVNFAGPYFVAAQDLLVKADDTSITGPSSLNGKNLCSVTGSTPAQKVKEKYAADVSLQEYGTYTECVEALRASAGGPLDVNAVTTDNVILAGYAAQYPGELKVVGEGFSTENYGIGLKKGDTAGTQAINDALTAMIADGSWKKALEATVGPSGFTLPAPPTPGA